MTDLRFLNMYITFFGCKEVSKQSHCSIMNEEILDLIYFIHLSALERQINNLYGKCCN